MSKPKQADTDSGKSSESKELLKKVGEKIAVAGEKLESGVKTAAKWGSTMTEAATVVGGAVSAATEKITDNAQQVAQSAETAGASVENWQKLNYAFESSGVSSDILESSMVKNKDALEEASSGVGTYAEAYSQLGVSLTDTSGNARDSDEVFQEVLGSLADMGDVNERNALANQLFGESYTELAPLLDGGSESISALTARAGELGIVLSEGTINAGAQFGDTLSDVKEMGSAVFNMLGTEMLPILQAFLDWIIQEAPAIQEKVGAIAQFIKDTVAGLFSFWEENGALIAEVTGQVFAVIQEVIQIAMNAIKGIVDVVLGILSGDWEKTFGGLSTIVGSVMDLCGTLINGGLDAILRIITGMATVLCDAGGAAISAIWEGMQEKWTDFTAWVTEKFAWLKEKLMFWKKSESEMNTDDKKKKKNGSHSAGLAYVPFDGYQAELHRGERVLAAEAASEYNSAQRGKQGSSGDTYNFYSPKALTPTESARQMRKAKRSLLFDF